MNLILLAAVVLLVAIAGTLVVSGGSLLMEVESLRPVVHDNLFVAIYLIVGSIVLILMVIQAVNFKR